MEPDDTAHTDDILAAGLAAFYPLRDAVLDVFPEMSQLLSAHAATMDAFGASPQIPGHFISPIDHGPVMDPGIDHKDGRPKVELLEDGYDLSAAAGDWKSMDEANGEDEANGVRSKRNSPPLPARLSDVFKQPTDQTPLELLATPRGINTSVLRATACKPAAPLLAPSQINAEDPRNDENTDVAPSGRKSPGRKSPGCKSPGFKSPGRPRCIHKVKDKRTKPAQRAATKDSLSVTGACIKCHTKVKQCAVCGDWDNCK